MPLRIVPVVFGSVNLLFEKGNLSARMLQNKVVVVCMGELELMRVSQKGTMVLKTSCYIRGGPISKMYIDCTEVLCWIALEPNIPLSIYLKRDLDPLPYAEWQISVLKSVQKTE